MYSTNNIAFVTNQGGNLYWGAPGGTLLSASLVTNYISQSNKPANDFMLSFGGATNNDGWNYFNQSDADVKAIANSLSEIVQQTGIAGVDIDVDIPSDSATFKSNFHTFISQLSSDLRSQGKLLSIDLPNTGACGASVNADNTMCIWSQSFGGSWGKAVWFFSGDYSISQYIDYYNVMSYSWPSVGSTQAINYTEDSVLSYNKIGASFDKMNVGIDVGEDGDKSNIDDNFINGIVDYANKNNLKGIFIWDYNTDYANSGTYSNLTKGGNTTVVNALLA